MRVRRTILAAQYSTCKYRFSCVSTENTRRKAVYGERYWEALEASSNSRD